MINKNIPLSLVNVVGTLFIGQTVEKFILEDKSGRFRYARSKADYQDTSQR
jgi:hypothetical protein